MKSLTIAGIVLTGCLTLAGCTSMSEQEIDETAGLNGGFELTKNGIPVNWLMYTPETVPTGDFTITLDKSEFLEGSQSLRFDIKECSSDGGWHSPGFTNEFFEVGKYMGPAKYKLRFWAKNDGTRWKMTAGSVESHGGEMNSLIDSDDNLSEWELFEYEINVQEDQWLRVQLNLLSPGTFWIDDFQVEIM